MRKFIGPCGVLAAMLVVRAGMVGVCCAEEPPSSKAATNAVVNPGFEEWGAASAKEEDAAWCPQAPDGLPEGWLPNGGASVSMLVRDVQVKHGGQCSLRMESKAPASVGVTQCVDADPETRYRIGMWLKGENIGMSGGAMIHVVASGNNDKRDRNIWVGFLQGADWYRHPSKRDGTFDWQEFAFTVDTPPGARALRMTLELRGASGTLWIDDVQVLEREKIVQVESY